MDLTELRADLVNIDRLIDELVFKCWHTAPTLERFDRLRLSVAINHIARARQHVSQATGTLAGPLVIPGKERA